MNGRVTGETGAERFGSLHGAFRATDSVTLPGAWFSVRTNVATPLASVVAVTGPCVPIVSFRTTPDNGLLFDVSGSVALYVFPQSKSVPDVLASSVIAVVALLIVSVTDPVLLL